MCLQRLQGRKSADSKDSETLPLQEQAACEPSALARPAAVQAQSLSRVGRDAQVARLRQEVSARQTALQCQHTGCTCWAGLGLEAIQCTAITVLSASVLVTACSWPVQAGRVTTDACRQPLLWGYSRDAYPGQGWLLHGG